MVRGDLRRAGAGRIHRFIASCVRYSRTSTPYFSIAANPFPAFGGAPGYPVDVEIAPPLKQSRLTIFFRGLLVIPAWIVLYFLATSPSW